MICHPAEQLLADVEWLLSECESFVLDTPLAQFLRSDWSDVFADLQANPQILLEHMASAKSHFLGTYFEQLFSFVVRHFTILNILAEHQQIHVGGKTFGEVDLLAESEGITYQFEIALKFYLGFYDEPNGTWIGPNKNDSLQKKTNHAREHQLKILTVSEGKEWLRCVSDGDHVVPNLLVYGRHFYFMKNASCEFFAHSHWRGGWLRLSDLTLAAPYLSALSEASKPYWITPNIDKPNKKQINNELLLELSERFVHDNRPVLYSCSSIFRPPNSDTFWLFVCPDDW